MSKLINKFKVLFVMIRPLSAFINSLVVMFAIFFIGTENDINSTILGGMAWLFISFANEIIKEYYETLKLKLNFPGNVLSKEIISPFEAMAYYTYFTLSAILLSTFIGTFPMFLAVFVTLFNKYSSKSCRKNPYRFPFSRGIIAAIMILYSGIEAGNANSLMFPAALFCIFTYIINYLDYSRYYEKITDKDAKSFLSTLIPGFLLISLYPYLQGVYKFDYLTIIMLTANLCLIFTLLKIFKGYRKSNVSALVVTLRLNLLTIIIAVYAGLK